MRREVHDAIAEEHVRDYAADVAAERRCSQILLRLAGHPLSVRLEKTRIELRAELGRSPSERETWLEFQERHPTAARYLLASVAREAAPEETPA